LKEVREQMIQTESTNEVPGGLDAPELDRWPVCILLLAIWCISLKSIYIQTLVSMFEINCYICLLTMFLLIL
jgi:hypothetical protein